MRVNFLQGPPVTMPPDTQSGRGLRAQEISVTALPMLILFGLDEDDLFVTDC